MTFGTRLIALGHPTGLPAGRDRFRVVILKLNSKEYIDGVLKSKVNFEFLVNLFVSENDRIH